MAQGPGAGDSFKANPFNVNIPEAARVVIITMITVQNDQNTTYKVWMKS